MTASRKDSKGRVLRKGELERRNGTYSYTYKDKYGERRIVYAKTLQELRKKEESLTKDALDGIDSYSARTVTLNELFDRYIKTKTKLKDTTRANYIYMFDTYVRETFGKLQLSVIKYSDVLSFYEQLLSEKLAINTLEVVHTTIHPAFQMAVNDNIIRTNPSDRIMAKLKEGEPKYKGVRNALTKEQQRAFINHCRNSKKYWRWHPLLTVMLGTGCRVGEIIGLRWEDIDFEKRLISINHTVSDHSTLDENNHRVNVLKVSTPKTDAGTRLIPMMEKVYDALVEERDYQSRFGFNTTVIDGMSGFIFQNRNGSVFRACTINRAIERIRTDYNDQETIDAAKENREPILIPYFTCHHLRHTFCTRFCENEKDMKTIQEIMGHADITTTMDIYAEATAESKVNAIQSLSKNMDVF